MEIDINDSSDARFEPGACPARGKGARIWNKEDSVSFSLECLLGNSVFKGDQLQELIRWSSWPSWKVEMELKRKVKLLWPHYTFSRSPQLKAEEKNSNWLHNLLIHFFAPSPLLFWCLSLLLCTSSQFCSISRSHHQVSNTDITGREAPKMRCAFTILATLLSKNHHYYHFLDETWLIRNLSWLGQWRSTRKKVRR